VAKYNSLPVATKSRQLPDALDQTLTTLIRRQRNELGHPQEVPPAVDRGHAFVTFQLFLIAARDVEVFAKFCKTNGI
jgi:hypothetical protein